MDSSGNLYGVTAYGGTGNCVLLGDSWVRRGYEMSPPQQKGGAWTETILYSFPTSKQGYVPTRGLVFDKSGNLYGATISDEREVSAGVRCCARQRKAALRNNPEAQQDGDVQSLFFLNKGSIHGQVGVLDSFNRGHIFTSDHSGDGVHFSQGGGEPSSGGSPHYKTRDQRRDKKSANALQGDGALLLTDDRSEIPTIIDRPAIRELPMTRQETPSNYLFDFPTEVAEAIRSLLMKDKNAHILLRACCPNPPRAPRVGPAARANLASALRAQARQLVGRCDLAPRRLRCAVCTGQRP